MVHHAISRRNAGPNERADYANFLGAIPLGYELCLFVDHIDGAFGLTGSGLRQQSLNWILLAPRSQGRRIGTAIMNRVSTLSHQAGMNLITIAASHKSAPFFAKFGAIEISARELSRVRVRRGSVNLRS